MSTQKAIAMFASRVTFSLMQLPPDLIVMLLAMCAVQDLASLAAASKLVNEVTELRRKKVYLLRATPFRVHFKSLTCVGECESLTIETIDRESIIQLSEAAAVGALAQLQVSLRLTVFIPCLETWHTRSPDLSGLFDVPLLLFAEADPLQ